MDKIQKQFAVSESKIVATVTDNGSNFIKAFKEFGIELHTEDHPLPAGHSSGSLSVETDERSEDFEGYINVMIEDCNDESIILPPHYRCCSHTLSLVCTSDAKKNKNDVSYTRLRNSAFAKCSSLWNAAGRPQSAEKIYEILGCHLKLPCPTRWNSFYDSVGTLVKKKNLLHPLMLCFDLPPFREIEIAFSEEYVKVLYPVAIALDRLQGEQDCYYGVMLPTLLATEKKLNQLQSEALLHCQPLLNAVSGGFQSRFGEFLKFIPPTDSAVKAAILATTSNAQFKLRWLTINPEYNNAESKKIIQDMLVAAVKNATMASTFGPTDLAADSDSSSDTFFAYEGSEATTSTSCTFSEDSQYEMEVLKYLADSRHSINSLEDFPGCKNVFLRYNTPLPSSAAVERLFSFAGHIFAPKRKRTSDGLFEDIVFLKGNIHYL